MAAASFTGERPGWGKDFAYDEARHLSAYLYAAELAAGKRVLDAGCGEGFGTQTLADAAESVLGLDYSAEAIGVCRETWQRPNLTFEQLDLTRPGSFKDTFDLVLNFQVLEHIEDEPPFLEGLKARIAPGGCLLLTTPNRLESISENPYHVREYTADELVTLLGRVFPRVRLLGMHGNAKVTAYDADRERAVARILRLDPLGLRDHLPRAVINFAFGRLSKLVRRQIAGDEAGPGIVPSDFAVAEDSVDSALDLVAICEV